MGHTCANEFLDSITSIKQLLTKYQIFMKLPKIPHIHINRNFLSIFATFLINCFILINVMAGTCQDTLFFIFASCEAIDSFLIQTQHLTQMMVDMTSSTILNSRAIQ